MNDIPETCFSRIFEVKVIFFGRYQLQTTHFWWLHVRWWSLELLKKSHMFGGAETTRCAYQTVLLMYSSCVYSMCMYIYIYTHPYAYSIKLKTLPSAKWLFGCWFQLCRCEKPIDDIDIGWWDDGAQILTVHSQYVGAYWAILGHQHNCLLHCTQLHHWPMAVAQVVGAATSMLPWLQK